MLKVNKEMSEIARKIPYSRQIVKNTVQVPDETPPELAVLSDGLGEKREVETRGMTKKRARKGKPMEVYV